MEALQRDPWPDYRRKFPSPRQRPDGLAELLLAVQFDGIGYKIAYLVNVEKKLVNVLAFSAQRILFG